MNCMSNNDLQGMLQHWVGCPANGYLGSSPGGRDMVHALLQGLADPDEALALLQRDVPPFSVRAQRIQVVHLDGGGAGLTVHLADSSLITVVLSAV